MVRKSKMPKMPKILFLVKKRSDDMSPSFGLSNSANFVSEFLKKEGIKSNLAACIDANYVDKHVTEHDPDVVIIEAIWITPLKLKEILSIKRHQRRAWIIRIHSRVSFLAYEGNAFSWIKGYNEVIKDYPNTKILMAPNTEDFTNDLINTFNIPSIYLPNTYNDESYNFEVKIKQLGTINIGCFGAIRPFKNHLTQSLAAISFANQNNLKLNFHINGDRCEQKGESVLKNLQSVFEICKNHKLIKHSWMDHKTFIELVGTMDLGMQVSFSETFNLVSADFVMCGVPIVVSNQIKWLPDECQVAECNSVQDIINCLNFIWNKIGKDHIELNKKHLIKANLDAKKIWLNFLI